jgi:hypothetical protein
MFQQGGTNREHAFGKPDDHLDFERTKLGRVRPDHPAGSETVAATAVRLGATKLIASTALRARLGLFSGGFNSAYHHLIKVTPYLFFGAAELPQASLDLLDSRPALYFLECV